VDPEPPRRSDAEGDELAVRPVLLRASEEPKRIRKVDGIAVGEAVEVEAAREPDGVFLREPAGQKRKPSSGSGEGGVK
jgi:hypothetical protein